MTTQRRPTSRQSSDQEEEAAPPQRVDDTTEKRRPAVNNNIPNPAAQFPAGVPGAYRVKPSGSSTAATQAAVQHAEDGFPGQVFFVPGESLLTSRRGPVRSEEEGGIVDSSVSAQLPNSAHGVLDELDRLGVLTIRDAVAIAVHDDDDDEENIPSAEVSRVHVAEPLTTKLVCCLHKEVNRGAAKWISCFLLLLLVVSIASVGVIWNNSKKDDNNKAIIAEKNMVKPGDEEANIKYIQELVSSLSSQEDLQDPSSPQSKALAWMLGPDKLNFSTFPQDGFDWDSRVKERYALAVLYYSTNGENWTRGESYLTTSPICGWDTSFIKCHPMILNTEDEEGKPLLDESKFVATWAGRVVGLNFGKFTLPLYYVLLV